MARISSNCKVFSHRFQSVQTILPFSIVVDFELIDWADVLGLRGLDYNGKANKEIGCWTGYLPKWVRS